MLLNINCIRMYFNIIIILLNDSFYNVCGNIFRYGQLKIVESADCEIKNTAVILDSVRGRWR